jgi:hypothetical protein
MKGFLPMTNIETIVRAMERAGRGEPPAQPDTDGHEALLKAVNDVTDADLRMLGALALMALMQQVKTSLAQRREHLLAIAMASVGNDAAKH